MKFERNLLSAAMQARLWLILTIGLGFVAGAVIVGQAWFLARIVDGVFLQGRTLADVTSLLAALAALALARFLFAWGSESAGKRLAVRVKIDIRERLARHLLALGPTYAAEERSGELANTLTTGVEALDAWFSQYLPQAALALIMPLTILVAVFPQDRLSGFVLLVTAPLIPLFMILIGSSAESLTRKQWTTLSRLAAHYLDVIQGLTTLKLFGRAREQLRIIARISDDYRTATMGVLRVAFLSALALEMLATISVAVIAVEIGIRVMKGGMDFLNAFFILILAPDFYQPLRLLGSRFHAGMEGMAAAERIFAILDQQPTVERRSEDRSQRTEDRGQKPELRFLPPDFSIRFQNVSVSYQEGQRQALEEVNFELRQGQHIALVGPSGAGKSTIAHLLMRFLEPAAGRILLDDTPLDRIDARAWRQCIAWMPQRPYLFNMSIADNIRLGQPDARMDAVVRAAKQAFAHDFIQAFPDGYDTIVGERGARLSGGQAQRIALARAFLRDAPIVILDEPTANLDPETEEQIQQAMQMLLAGRTALIIAHRLHTIRRADRILVMQAGRIAEAGDHEALLAAPDSLYRQLLGAYLGDDAQFIERTYRPL
ncbi:MAG TPA: thiol reductant ABC exporter subunit CydD, partial [Anaerolineae bacterium]|nr:thiol reductant ABC exporter subunit CydD [Anaerolineae bacterium]